MAMKRLTRTKCGGKHSIRVRFNSGLHANLDVCVGRGIRSGTKNRSAAHITAQYAAHARSGSSESFLPRPLRTILNDAFKPLEWFPDG
jgi:hypothetical protein